MQLQNGYSLPEFSWEFSWYDWHKDKSSDVLVIPTSGILQKNKKRSKKRSMHELVALSAWNRLLSHHSTEDLSISSPTPYGVDEHGRIFMEFLQWPSADSLLSDNYDSNGTTLTRKDIRKDFSKRLWRILRIKDIEWLAHWDFQLRHLIHSVNRRNLWVIDVENSQVNPWAVKAEHDFVKGQIEVVFRQSPRFKQYMADGIEEWYYTEIDDMPILSDIASQLRDQLWFHNEQVGRFLQS